MALRESKEAVKIDDRVRDIRGTFVGWVDATHELPPGKDMEAYRVAYKPYVDVNKSWIMRFYNIVSELVYNTTGKPMGIEVSNTIYPKSGIEGFNGGTTVEYDNNNEGGAPEKRVILHEDIYGDAPYLEQTGPESDRRQQKVTRLKEKVNDLQMQLQAEEGKSQELEEEVDREKDSSNRTGYGPERYPTEQEGHVEEDY